MEDQSPLHVALRDVAATLCRALLRRHARWVWRYVRYVKGEERLVPELPRSMCWGYEMLEAWAPRISVCHPDPTGGRSEYTLHKDGDWVGVYRDRATAIVYGDNMLSTWRKKELGE